MIPQTSQVDQPGLLASQRQRNTDHERLPLLQSPPHSPQLGTGDNGLGVDEEQEVDHDGCFPPHGVRELCPANPNRDLPVYRTIHKIRRAIISAIDDPYSIEQLRDPRMNISVVRPLVDRFYEDRDVSMIYCLLVNRSKFLREQLTQTHQQNVCTTRALLCEIIASRILRRFHEDNPGAQGLLLLAQILVGGFDPFQGAPPSLISESSLLSLTIQTRTGKKRKMPALEIAIISESKTFLASSACQKVVNAIYEGRVVYTPSSFMDILPDHYKQKPISLYNPRKAPLLNQYRLIVPRTRNYLEVCQFVILLVLFLLVMGIRDRDPRSLEGMELVFIVYTIGWSLDQFACMLEHGWHVYTQNLWSFLDVTFITIFSIYLVLRFHGLRTHSPSTSQQALDVLAMGAPIIVPRLAFNLMSEHMLFVSLRAMMRDFTVLTVLAVWCFAGFLLSMTWLSNGSHEPITIMKWMLWVWFGLDATGIQRSVDFHWLLGPILMVAFAFLGNTLFLTILVSMLSTTFSTIVSNATAEIQFRRAVLTLEGVKSDAIFAYQPPFNIIALLILLPLKICVTPRWFHKINVAAQRTLNAPILLLIGFLERRTLWSGMRRQKEAEPLTKSQSRTSLWDFSRGFSVHGDIAAVFENGPPQEDDDSDDISDEDDLEMGREIIKGHTPENPETNDFEREFGDFDLDGGNGGPKLKRTMTNKSRRDSVAPFGEMKMAGGLGSVLDGDSEDGDVNGGVLKRLEVLEMGMDRIEKLLVRLLEGLDDAGSREGPELGETGTMRDLDRSGTTELDN